MTEEIAATHEAEFVDITPEGNGKLRKRIIQEGTGDLISRYSDVSVHYTGRLHPSGTKFDSSLDRNKPLEFKVSEGRVIKGWDEGLVTMRVGEKAELLIDPEYGYGVEGNPPTIPPNSTLLFEVEVISSKPLEDPVSKKIADAAASKTSGNAYFTAGKYAEAAKAYRFGISRLEVTWSATPAEIPEINQLKLNLNSNLAACLLKTKNLKEAVEACDKALEVDVKNVKVLYRMGQAYSGLAMFDKAEEVLKQALEVAPKDAAVLQELASLSVKAKDLKDKEKAVYSRMFK
ncbi:cytochrome P450 monooxygenase 9 [Rhizoclosmatium sp. JEL0117]|nr:cytochrome P450 monooxygenase 9 [Rhizoclosmatium sp. JEL0117]